MSFKIQGVEKMKTLFSSMLYITVTLPSIALASGSPNLSNVNLLPFLFVVMGISSIIFLIWLFFSIKYTRSNKHNISNFKVTIYIVLSSILIYVNFVIANFIITPHSYLFYFYAYAIIVYALFLLLKIIQKRSSAFNE